VLRSSPADITFIPDGYDASATQTMNRSTLTHVFVTDEHGGLIKDDVGVATQPAVPVAVADPVAPPVLPVGKSPTYYVIPLHGAVGETILANVLEKSLADAVKRQPTVVVLDIDSPGGLVEEAKQIITVLHKYNKKLRIVALTGQDLSAAAILTLSAKEIYVKSSSTIGAATSYVSSNMTMSGKLEEKMQSAWRAVARNSAEEGGHEPMLADAMIDNDQELHWETVNGKPVVKDGKGDHMICRKGKVLTLSSHEAVDCGLASGDADDIDELGKALKLDNWTEMKGLGTLLAEALPKRVEAYKAEMDRIGVRFVQDLEAAVKADPTQQVTTVSRVITTPGTPAGVPVAPRPYIPQPYIPQPGIPQPGIPRPGIRPGYPGNPMMPAQPVQPSQQIVTETRGTSPAAWKGDSIACVVALFKVEGDLNEVMALSGAYGHTNDTEMVKDLREKLGVIRGTVYDNRNKYLPVLPTGALRTQEVGGPGTVGYVTTGPAGKPMLGFQCTLNTAPTGGTPKPVIAKLAPLFSVEANPPAEVVNVVAKDGYAVGGLIVDTDGKYVVAVKVIFVGYKNGHVVKSDTYTSDWVGTADTNKPVTLGGNGEMVVGTCGRNAANLAAIGLLVVPEAKK